MWQSETEQIAEATGKFSADRNAKTTLMLTKPGYNLVVY